jgi:hypothetical protein
MYGRWMGLREGKEFIVISPLGWIMSLLLFVLVVPSTSGREAVET